MKKYNTPEMVVATFDKESVLTESTGFATFNAFVEKNNIADDKVFVKSLADLNITF